LLRLRDRCSVIRGKVEAAGPGETAYNLQDASVTDLSDWLSEVQCGSGGHNLEDYRAKTSGSRPRRDDGKYVTPR